MISLIFLLLNAQSKQNPLHNSPNLFGSGAQKHKEKHTTIAHKSKINLVYTNSSSGEFHKSTWVSCLSKHETPPFHSVTHSLSVIK